MGRALRGEHNGAAVQDLTLAQVQSLDASGVANGAAGDAVRAPTMEQAVMSAMEGGLNVFLDVKLPRGNVCAERDLVKHILAMFQRHPALYDRCVVCSFYPTVLWQLRRADQDIALGQTYFDNIVQFAGLTPLFLGGEREDIAFRAVKVLATVADWLLSRAVYTGLLPSTILDVDVMLLHKQRGGMEASNPLLSRQDVDTWTRLGLPVVVWTVEGEQEETWFQRLPVLYMVD